MIPPQPNAPAARRPPPQGELAAQFSGKTVLLGVDDMDVFKGIELKLQVGCWNSDGMVV